MTAIRARAKLLLLAAAVVLGPAAFAASPAAQSAAAASATQQRFDSAEAAAAALIEAARSNRPEALQAILGPGSDRLLSSGDKVMDAAERQRFLAAYDERHRLVASAPDRMVLQVGKDDWPLPIPLIEADGKWRFDSTAGAQELVNRRIGRNEIAAIRTALAYLDAQKAFFAFAGRNGEGEYAQRLLASPGRYDGLYWPAAEGVPDSPLEPLVAQAREEGYPIDTGAQAPRPYHGYLFRILTGQGAHSPDGARSYVSNGRMSGGFALIAWPATYGASGIMTFIVNQDGVVFQKDLGPRTGAIAAATRLFDPDLSWAKVEVVD